MILLFVVAIAVIYFVFEFVRSLKKKSFDNIGIPSAILLMSLFFTFVFGCIAPLGNYVEESELIEVKELMPMPNSDTGGVQFVYVDKNLEYRYISKYPQNSKEKTLKNSDMAFVTQIESKECDTPVLKIYKRKEKMGWITLGLHSRIEYVFYVPYNTIGGLYNDW
ncbi:MAG: hypothetical protein IKV94_00170 [Clostridia bacterium]|nr:hypothetical protein [Clostridia bacterium]